MSHESKNLLVKKQNTKKQNPKKKRSNFTKYFNIKPFIKLIIL